MKKYILLAILWPAFACAEISGPTTSSGEFSLAWTEPNSILVEVDSTGTIVDSWASGPAEILKPDGTFTYWEYLCMYLPFVGNFCFSTDTHQVMVTTGVGTPGSQYPESAGKQAEYEFIFRAGDFVNTGRIDILVERIESGPVDGSMQSYIIYQHADGVLHTKKPVGSQLAYAKTFPVNNTLNLMPGDINADGFTDHMIEGLQAVMGPEVVDDYIVFAGGSAADKTAPQGATEIDNEFTAYTTDLSQWLNDDEHFANNIMLTTIPLFSIGFGCSGGFNWFDGISGFFSHGLCGPSFQFVGSIPVLHGINFDALAASSHIESIYEDYENISDDDLWQLSLITKNIFNVHSFGFDDSGIRQPTNHGEDTDAEEKTAAMIQFSYMLMASGFQITIQQGVPHDYRHVSDICDTSQAYCTLANIACWGRHFHAPLEDKNGHDTPVENGEVSDLEDRLWHENEIRTGVGEAAGLPPNAIANVTEPSHILHDLDGPGFGVCPQPVSGQGTGPVNECSQVYREPFESEGKIKMRTRGFGDNRFAIANQIVGKRIFKELDDEMKEAIEMDSDGICPSL